MTIGNDAPPCCPPCPPGPPHPPPPAPPPGIPLSSCHLKSRVMYAQAPPPPPPPPPLPVLPAVPLPLRPGCQAVPLSSPQISGAVVPPTALQDPGLPEPPWPPSSGPLLSARQPLPGPPPPPPSPPFACPMSCPACPLGLLLAVQAQ